MPVERSTLKTRLGRISGFTGVTAVRACVNAHQPRAESRDHQPRLYQPVESSCGHGGESTRGSVTDGRQQCAVQSVLSGFILGTSETHAAAVEITACMLDSQPLTVLSLESCGFSFVIFEQITW